MTTAQKPPGAAYMRVMTQQMVTPGDLRDAEDDLAYVAHGRQHPAHHDEIVERRAESRLEPSQERRGLAGVAHLDELVIRDDLGAAPEEREGEDGEKLPYRDGEPHPVGPYAVGADVRRDEERRVRREARRYHRAAEEPPGHGAAADEVLGGVLAGAAGEVEADGRGSARSRRRLSTSRAT